MAEVYFDQTRVPRSLGRAKWRETYRRVRVMKRQTRVVNDMKVRLLRANKEAMTTSQRAQIIYELVNPPLLLGPYQ